MVIHDLRGPATSINMGSEIVLKSIKELIGKENTQPFNDQVSFTTKFMPSFMENKGRSPSIGGVLNESEAGRFALLG